MRRAGHGQRGGRESVGPPAAAGLPGPGVTPPPDDPDGRLVEAVRLASATPVVPELVAGRPLPCGAAGPHTDPVRVEDGMGEVGTVAPILEKYGFVASWRGCASPRERLLQPERTVAHTLELADPASARAAATELAAAFLRSGEQETTVLGGARAQTRTDEGLEHADVWVPVGRTLAVVQHDDAPGRALGEATRLAEAHAALLAGFVPTPQADVAALPFDPLGLEARTVAAPGRDRGFTAHYDLAASVQASWEPVADRALLTANGFLGSFRKRTSNYFLGDRVAVYAFPGPAQAEAVGAAFAARPPLNSEYTHVGLPAVPGASACRAEVQTDIGAQTEASFSQWCSLTVGGLLAVVSIAGSGSPQDTSALADAVAAQRDLLTRG